MEGVSGAAVMLVDEDDAERVFGAMSVWSRAGECAAVEMPNVLGVVHEGVAAGESGAVAAVESGVVASGGVLAAEGAGD